MGMMMIVMVVVIEKADVDVDVDAVVRQVYSLGPIQSNEVKSYVGDDDIHPIEVEKMQSLPLMVPLVLLLLVLPLNTSHHKV
jgi:hypothetical protein